jgi:hypothetical protein
VAAIYQQKKLEGNELEANWNSTFHQYELKYPDLAAEFKR